MAAGAVRMVRALGKRAGGDVDALPLLAELAGVLDDATHQAVVGCRAAGWSWADIGRVLGTSAQAVQQRHARRVQAAGGRPS